MIDISIRTTYYWHMKDIIAIVWFLLPAGFANMAPIIFNRVNFLNVPIDFNKQFKGQPIFGPHKTYRGFFFGIMLSIIVVYFQRSFYPSFPKDSLVNYDTENLILLGFLLGFGALFGDLVKSFFKRRFNISSGKSWIPFDQIDWIAGALLFASFIVVPNNNQLFIALVFFAIAHPISNLVGYWLHFKSNKF